MDWVQDRDRANRLRAELVERITLRGISHNSQVLAAIATVPRDVFLPEVAPDVAYADQQVYIKWNAVGEALSAASKPSVVAMMLDQLEVRAGDRVLEVGTGTGYNAALLSELVGPTGRVTTVEVDPELANRARHALATAGYEQVAVVCSDGEQGFEPAAPYDRIVVTAGAGDIPPAWQEQLATHGRLVVPLRIRGSLQRSIAFVREAGHWVSRSSRLCTFMPMRGGDAPARRTITLPVPAEDSAKPATLHVYREQPVEPGRLHDVFAGPVDDAWSGVRFSGGESFDGMELWLACHHSGFCRLQFASTRPARGTIRPALPWGSSAVVEDNTLAYLTIRTDTASPSGGDRAGVEVGVRAHGPRSGELAEQLATQIKVWDSRFRRNEPWIEARPSTEPSIPTVPCVIDKPHVRLTIDWDRQTAVP